MEEAVNVAAGAGLETGKAVWDADRAPALCGAEATGGVASADRGGVGTAGTVRGGAAAALDAAAPACMAAAAAAAASEGLSAAAGAGGVHELAMVAAAARRRWRALHNAVAEPVRERAGVPGWLGATGVTTPGV